MGFMERERPSEEVQSCLAKEQVLERNRLRYAERKVEKFATRKSDRSKSDEG
jgi:hypothetical protein